MPIPKPLLFWASAGVPDAASWKWVARLAPHEIGYYNIPICLRKMKIHSCARPKVCQLLPTDGVSILSSATLHVSASKMFVQFAYPKRTEEGVLFARNDFHFHFIRKVIVISFLYTLRHTSCMYPSGRSTFVVYGREIRFPTNLSVSSMIRFSSRSR